MKRILYFYERNFYINFIATVGNFYYGADHPMKPFRIKMAHQLIVNYGLYRSLNVYASLNYLRNHIMLQVKKWNNFIPLNTSNTLKASHPVL